MKISDYVIISDVDGTLLPYGGDIPRRNREAVERFISKGGRFGIATGRSKELTEEFVKSFSVNAPCVLYNGGGLYDFGKGKFLMEMFLPESAKEDVETIRKAFPDISVLVITNNSYYHISTEIPFASFSEMHRKIAKEAYVETLTSPWYKALFSLSEAESAAFDEYLSTASFDGVRFVRTNPTLVELLPVAANKGSALKKLVELGYFKRGNIAAIGDYYNDAEMIEFAGIGAVTAEAPDDIKEKAKFVAGSCDGGAVADLVEYLERIAD